MILNIHKIVLLYMVANFVETLFILVIGQVTTIYDLDVGSPPHTLRF